MPTLVGKTIQFTDKLYDNADYATIPFDSGMLADVVNVNDNDGVITLELDFTKYEDANDELMRATWPNRLNDPLLTWRQTPFYPRKTKRSTIIIHRSKKPFKVLKNE